MSYYECRRCLHRTKQKNDMSRHLNRKNKCTRNIESYKYSDDDINILSLKKINENEQFNDIIIEQINEPLNIISSPISNISNPINVNNDPIKLYIENPSNIEQNNTKCILIKQVTNNDNQNIQFITNKKCPNCDKYFTRRGSLIRHIENNRCKSVCYKTEQKITNNITNNNNTIIINLNLNKPLPFDSDWDVSNIDNTLKQVLLLSDLKYTKTLEYILQNDVNLNVIIENESECGIVYKNDVEKFKPMKIEDIVDLSMDKLHKQLTIFHDEIKDNNKYQIKDTILKTEKHLLDEKYDAYKNNENTQNLVKSYISNIYNKKKEDTIKICSELLELGKIEGY